MEFEDLVKIINDQIFVVAEKIEDEDGIQTLTCFWQE